MKQIRLLFLLLITSWLYTETVQAQQIAFRGRKYDYKFVFQGYNIEKNDKKEGKKTGVLTIYLSRKGYGIALFENKSKPFSFDNSSCNMEDPLLKYRAVINLSEAMGIDNNEVLKEIINGTNILRASVGNITAKEEGKARLLIYNDGSCSFEYKNSENDLFCLTPLKQTRKQVLTKIYELVLDGSFLIGGTPTKGNKMVEKDGFVWYKVPSGELFGAADKQGNLIVPIKYPNIEYYNESDGYVNIFLKRAHYFLVSDRNGHGVYTRKGKCVLPTSRGYKNICMLTTDSGKIAWAVRKSDDYSGTKGWSVLDAKGSEVISSIDHLSIWDIEFCETKYGALVYRIYINKSNYSRGERVETNGLYDANGNEIVPVGKYKGFSFAFNDERGPYISAEERIPYKFTTETYYDYDSYDDLYYDWNVNQ